jgi:hypothetical protein
MLDAENRKRIEELELTVAGLETMLNYAGFSYNQPVILHLLCLPRDSRLHPKPTPKNHHFPQRDCLHHNHLGTLHHPEGVLQFPWPTLLDHPAISPLLYKKLLHLGALHNHHL